jgi:hypothetical protein
MLDRFAPVREGAQIGAAIGREFSYELLAAVARHAAPELDWALAQPAGHAAGRRLHFQARAGAGCRL